MPTSPTPACSWPATCRARSPAPICRSTAAGPCCEERGMSATADLIISGGTIVTPDSAFRASLAIKGGKVAAVGAADTMPPARETLDATGLHLLPGAIDVHVHF